MSNSEMIRRAITALPHFPYRQDPYCVAVCQVDLALSPSSASAAPDFLFFLFVIVVYVCGLWHFSSLINKKSLRI